MGKEKTLRKHLKQLDVLVPTMLLLKFEKRSVNFYVYFMKILLNETEFFSKLFYFDKTAKVKPIFVFLLLQSETYRF